MILEGEVVKVGWQESVIDAYEAKYAFRIEPANDDLGAYVLRPRVAQTWTESGYPKNAARWVFD